MQIVPRDVALMGWILEQKFMDIRQVKRVFWKDNSQVSTEAYRRLGELEKQGFLTKDDTYRYFLYLVTQKGMKLLRANGRDQGLSVVKAIDHSTILHDAEVTNVRILFHEMGFTEWIPEGVLSKFYELRHLPDGIIYHEGKHVAIEYESTQKSKRRYRRILLDYELEDYVDRVLYVVHTSAMMKKLAPLLVSCSKAGILTMQNLREGGFGSILASHENTSKKEATKTPKSAAIYIGGR